MASEEGILTLKERCAFGTAHLMNVLCLSGMWFSYILIFFTKVIGLPKAQAGLILLVAQFGGAMITPAMGLASDTCSCAYGRRKIFHLFGMIAMLSTFVFLWLDCLGCENAPSGYKVVYYSSFAIVVQFGWSAMQLAQLTMVPELTTHKATRMQLNQIRYALTTIGGLLVFVLFWILLSKLNKNSDPSDISPADKIVFWVMALILLALGFVITLPFQVWIRERSSLSARTKKIYEGFQKPMLYLSICAFTSGRVITVITQQYIPFYLLDSLDMPKTSIAIGPMVWYVLASVAAICIQKISSKIGDEMTYFCCLMLMFESVIWLWAKPTLQEISPSIWDQYSVYIPIAIFGATGSSLMVMNLTYMSTLTGSNIQSAGFVWGIALFSDRISNGLINILILHVATSSSATFYRYVLVYTNFGAGAIGLASVIIIALLKRREMNAAAALEQVSLNIQIPAALVDGASNITASVKDQRAAQDLHRRTLELFMSV